MEIYRIAVVLSRLSSGIIFMMGMSQASARDYFDPALLSLGAGQMAVTDLSAFETSGQTPPGRYLVTMIVNQSDRGQYNIEFTSDGKGQVIPQLTPDFLAELGVNTSALPAFSGLPRDKPIANLVTLIPDSRVHFNFSQLQLELSIPQIAMHPDMGNTADPSLWDQGMPAFLLNYNLSGGRNRQSSSMGIPSNEQTNLFVGLRGGLNWQAWRLRSDMNYTRNDSDGGYGDSQRYQKTRFSNTYLQRDLQALRSDILVGENSTGSDVFDSVPFRGIKLNSSEDMLPVNMRGFAPVISGIAQSNARVTISQNGSVVYQTYVAPGAFQIDNLYQTGQGGDLTVTVTEADGSVRTWNQAYSSLPVMLRPGGIKYEVTAGRYNGGITVSSRESNFALGSLIYGLPHDITLYGGALVANDYHSMVAGSGISLGDFGAFSADATFASATLFGEKQNGQSVRVRYAKSLLSTGTSVDLTAYRYSTRHYYSFADFNNTGYQLSEDQVPWALTRQRSNFQVRINQQFGTYGSMYLSGSRSDYWGNEQVNNNLSLGYNVNLHSISYGLAYSIDRIKSGGDWPQNRQLTFNMQVPFSLFTTAPALSNSYARYQMTHNSDGRVQQQAGITGSGMDNRLSYTAMQGWNNDDSYGSAKNTTTLNLGWQGSQGMINAGYGYSNRYSTLNINANGGLVAHPGGVTLSQSFGNAIVIVDAPDSNGTQVMNGNVQTNRWGYAVVPYASLYQKNEIILNPSTLPDDVDLTQSSVNVYPTRGAVVAAKFATRTGYQALLTITHNGKPLSFGTVVTLEDESKNSAIVGEAGQVYISGLPPQGRLVAVWGRGNTDRCETAFNLSQVAASANNSIRSLSLLCEGE